MKKYRTKRWPFLICLFSGLACSLTLPKVNLEPKPDNHSTAINQVKKIKDKCDVPGRNLHATQYNEGFPVGPQLLLVLQ